MYAIFLRSQKEPILVDDIQGIRLKEQWMQNKLPKRIEIGEWAGDSDQIKGIKSNATPDLDTEIIGMQQDQASKTNAYFRSVDEEYVAYRKHKLSQPPAERAKNLTIASMVWNAHTDREMPEDVRERIVERQQAYFEEFPNHAHANPICYRDIVEPFGADGVGYFKGALMRIAENACAADKREANKVTIRI